MPLDNLPFHALTGPLVRGVGEAIGLSFNPASLFANGEQGAVYVPSLRGNVNSGRAVLSDNPGLFETTVGAAAGVMYDIKEGMALGAVITGNGRTLQPGSGAATDNGDGTFTVANGGQIRFLYPLASLVNGARYEVSLTVTAHNGGGTGGMDLCDVDIFTAYITTTGTYTGTAQRSAYDATYRFVDVTSFASGRSMTVTAPTLRRVAGNHATQATATAQPLFKAAPDRLDFDAVGDALVTTFAASLGSACTVVRAVPSTGASILTAQTIGTSFSDNTDHCGLIIINRALTAVETQKVTQWANARASAAQSMVNFFACWGDSLTDGAGATGQTMIDGYPLALAQLMGRNYYNGGVGGDTSTQIKTRVLADTQGRNGWVNLLWIGRNNATDPTTVKADIAACVSNMGSNTRYVVMSILASSADDAPTLAAISALNTDLATLYGTRYLDVRAYLQSKGDGSANDLADIAAGFTPRSLRFDGLHLNNTGYQHVANCVQAKLTSLGY